MKRPIALSCVIFLVSQASAFQKLPLIPSAGGAALDISTLRPATIGIKSANALPPPYCYFSHFEVIDERPDTARIGVHTDENASKNRRERQVIFAHGAAAEIAGFLNAHFCRPDAPFTALIVLRTLWLTDANNIHQDIDHDPDKKIEKNHIRLKAEIYAIKDNRYMPVMRFDTLQTTPKTKFLADYYGGPPFEDWEDHLALILDDMADTASRAAAKKQQNGGRWVSLDEIRQSNRTRFDPPVVIATTLVPGVYATFDEFKNNTPSVRNYKIDTSHHNLMLYLTDASGTAAYSRDAWGYCDGQSVFVMKDGILRPASKEGKAYYFYVDEEQQPGDSRHDPNAASTSVNGAGGFSIQRMIWHRVIYTVDMDTGNIY